MQTNNTGKPTEGSNATPISAIAIIMNKKEEKRSKRKKMEKITRAVRMSKNEVFILLTLLCLPCIFATDYFYDNFNDSGTYSLGSIYNQNGWNWNAFSTNTLEMEIYNDSGTLVYRQSNVASDYGEETKGVDVPVNDYFINVKLRINSYSSNIGSNYILGDFDNGTYDSFKLNCNESGELMINQAMAEAKTAVDNTTACDGNWHIITLECHEGNNSHVAYVDGVPFGVKSDYAKRESGFGHIGAFDTFKDTTSPQSFDMLWINISDNMTIETEPITSYPSQIMNNPENGAEYNNDTTTIDLNWTYINRNGSASDTCSLKADVTDGSTIINETYNQNNNTENIYELSVAEGQTWYWKVTCNDTFGNTNTTNIWNFTINETTEIDWANTTNLQINNISKCYTTNATEIQITWGCNGTLNCYGNYNITSNCITTNTSYGTYNISNGTTALKEMEYICLGNLNYINATVTNWNSSNLKTSKTLSCSTPTENALTEEEHGWLEEIKEAIKMLATYAIIIATIILIQWMLNREYPLLAGILTGAIGGLVAYYATNDAETIAGLTTALLGFIQAVLGSLGIRLGRK